MTGLARWRVLGALEALRPIERRALCQCACTGDRCDQPARGGILTAGVTLGVCPGPAQRDPMWQLARYVVRASPVAALASDVRREWTAGAAAAILAVHTAGEALTDRAHQDALDRGRQRHG